MNGWENFAIALSAFLACVGAVFRWVVKPVYRVVTAVDDQAPTLSDIAKEFRKNHGTSLRDTIDRLESKVDSNNQRIQGLEDSFKELLRMMR